MEKERGLLDMPSDNLDDFSSKSATEKTTIPRKDVDKVSGFPSREASREGQLSIKSPDDRILERFKAMCKADRRKYYDMLEILMDAFEGKGNISN